MNFMRTKTDYVSQKYSAQRELLCWFNNKIIWYISPLPGKV